MKGQQGPTRIRQQGPEKNARYLRPRVLLRPTVANLRREGSLMFFLDVLKVRRLRLEMRHHPTRIVVSWLDQQRLFQILVRFIRRPEDKE